MHLGPFDLDADVALTDIDLYDPGRYRSGTQHPAWRALRRSAPLWRQHDPAGLPFWSVTRQPDVLRVIKNSAVFSSAFGTILAVLGGDPGGGKTINLMDPPGHGRIRVPTMRLLSTAAMQRTAGLVHRRVTEIMAPVRDSGVVDLVPLMSQLAMAVVGDAIGIEPGDWIDVSRWTMTGVAPEDPHFATGDATETLRAAHLDLFAVIDEVIQDRRARPREDVISYLLAATIDDRPLTPEEIFFNCYSFLMGANTTTPHVGSQLVLQLMRDPEQWQLLRERPELIPDAVEEGIRWASPVNHLVRKVRRPVTIQGTRIEPGEFVCAWIGSANRDEEVFPDPYRLDVRRRPNPHLGFGHGRHYCNGAPGARLILAYALQELVDRCAVLEPAGPAEHLYSNFINGVTRLPVRVTAQAGRDRPPQIPVTHPIAHT